jgi:predicted GIY-YIG superfamily endonuclease
LYRLFDADGELLYIGISYSAIARFAQHKATQPWAGDVCRIEIETHDVSRREIEDIESAAIRDEKPKHNIAKRLGGSRWSNKREPHSEFDHSWPASAARLRRHYWAIQRAIGPITRQMVADGCKPAEVVGMFNEMIWAQQCPDMHHECQTEMWGEDLPIETPFARLADGWCFYLCRHCGEQWKCRY